MIATVQAVLDYGHLPSFLEVRLHEVDSQWRGGGPDVAVLIAVKRECWEYLQDKHGNSYSIADDEDRAIRAMLCTLEPVGDWGVASEVADWVGQMLEDGPFPPTW